VTAATPDQIEHGVLRLEAVAAAWGHEDAGAAVYWVRIVEFLQQNWALIDESAAGPVVWFVDDGGGVFDRITFVSQAFAEKGLRQNGFRPFLDDRQLRGFVGLPQLPFHPRPRPIYSSGRFWKQPVEGAGR
jgi:hypothetical protein